MWPVFGLFCGVVNIRSSQIDEYNCFLIFVKSDDLLCKLVCLVSAFPNFVVFVLPLNHKHGNHRRYRRHNLAGVTFGNLTLCSEVFTVFVVALAFFAGMLVVCSMCTLMIVSKLQYLSSLF